jgi:hypothetical protein
MGVLGLQLVVAERSSFLSMTSKYGKISEMIPILTQILHLPIGKTVGAIRNL